MAEDGRQIPERWSYDAFLSFHGPDVLKGFLSHLYMNLMRRALNVFKDDERLEIGGSISPQLLKAIEKSQVHVVVLSEYYASSAWCLDELFHIMECRKSNEGHVLVPIFYNINPSDVRRITGSYGASFLKHEKRYPESEVKKWKLALTTIANVSGLTRVITGTNKMWSKK